MRKLLVRLFDTVRYGYVYKSYSLYHNEYRVMETNGISYLICDRHSHDLYEGKPARFVLYDNKALLL